MRWGIWNLSIIANMIVLRSIFVKELAKAFQIIHNSSENALKCFHIERICSRRDNGAITHNSIEYYTIDRNAGPYTPWMSMRTQTMVHVGNNSVIRILSLADLSRPVANPRAVKKGATAFISAGAVARLRPAVNVRVNTIASFIRYDLRNDDAE